MTWGYLRESMGDDPEGAISRFLEDHEAEQWSTDTEVPAHVLPEVAGRLCYMSFAKPRPGGNSAYLGHIKEVGHGSVLEHSVWNFIITGVSLIGSEFHCTIAAETTIAGRPAIIPTLSGRAWITGTHQHMLDPTDPWPGGYRLSDTWPRIG